MIHGVGTDLINSERVEKLLKKFGNKFLFKIFSNEEINSSKKTCNKALYFSKRFAGKEAFWKAISPNKGNTLHFNEIEILSNNNGKPYINLIGMTKNKVTNLEKSLNCTFNFHISISDEKPYALAFVIIFLAHVNQLLHKETNRDFKWQKAKKKIKIVFMN